MDKRPLYIVEKVEDDDWWFATDSKGVDKFSAGFDNEQEAIDWAFDRNGQHRRWMDNLMWEIFGQPTKAKPKTPVIVTWNSSNSVPLKAYQRKHPTT